jgi:hypothetical protein
MKPPVVVVERHCKTNQCWIAVRFKKIPSVAKISQSLRSERACRGAGERVPLGHRGECLFSSCVRAPSSKVLSLAFAVCLALVTVETVPARPKKHHAERPVAPRVHRSVLPTVQSPSPPSLPLQLALPVYKPSPNQQRRAIASSLPALVCAQRGPRQRSHHRAFYVRSCTNIDRVNRLQRANEREHGGPRIPPRA